ncbi:MAG: K+/H+ antiporter subunit F [Sandarakinorhabdus sp.]|nr:K+/H+ antiporter subunit F [Sandarakinorhabdus sp.]
MLSIVSQIALAAIGIAFLLNLWRLVKGPDATDRILALDTMTINAIALIMLLGIVLGTTVYFEAALILAMMGFVGTVALCKFLLGGDIIE